MLKLVCFKGEWAGHGQIMNKEYAETGVTNVFPNKGRDYGYTLGLNGNDPVDTKAGGFRGMFAQCATFSHEHNAVVVSMGNGGSCGHDWTNSRHAIVSKSHPLFNTTIPVWKTGMSEADKNFIQAAKEQFQEEVRALEPVLSSNSTAIKMSAQDMESYKHYLAEFKK